MRKPESGFSVLELVIVLAIMLIITAVALPSIRQVNDNYQLNASGRNVAEVLRQAQMMAIQSNQIYYVQYGGLCGAPNRVCAVPVARFVAFNYIPRLDPTTITSGNVGFNPLGPGTNPPNLGAPLRPAGAVIGFNARGMPCVPAGVVAANPFLCQGPAAFEWYLETNFVQAANGASHSWGAVTVTPAGRIRSWRESAGVWN